MSCKEAVQGLLAAMAVAPLRGVPCALAGAEGGTAAVAAGDPGGVAGVDLAGGDSSHTRWEASRPVIMTL